MQCVYYTTKYKIDALKHILKQHLLMVLTCPNN